MEQSAGDVYIATICQPEDAFDLSVAAQRQHQELTDSDIKALNEQLEWQQQNLHRGLRFVQLDLEKAKLLVYFDGPVANNKCLTSQIGYTIDLADESTDGSLEIPAN